MKLLTYNIWYGGHPDRLPFIKKVIKQQAPDVVALQEANNFTKKTVDEFRKLGYSYAVHIKGKEDSGKGTFDGVVLAKQQFRVINRFKHMRNAGVHVYFPQFKPSLCSVHLTPYTEKDRLKELSIILKSQARYSNKMIVGDLNSLNADDKYPATLVPLFKKLRFTRWLTKGKLNCYGVIPALQKNGYVDMAQVLGTKDITWWTPIKEKPIKTLFRIDYCFVSKNLLPSVKSVRVIKNALTRKASDHYPVLVELEGFL